MTQNVETAERQHLFTLTLPNNTIRALERAVEEFEFDSIQEALLYFVRMGTHAGIILKNAPILSEKSQHVVGNGIFTPKNRETGWGIEIMFIQEIPAAIPSSDMHDIQRLNNFIFHKSGMGEAVKACLKQGLFVQEHILNSHLNSKTFREFRIDDVGKVTFTPHVK